MFVRPIQISKLADLGVCELKPYLYYILREKPVFGEWVRQGTSQHAVSRKIDEAKGYEKLEVQELTKLLADKQEALELPNERIRVKFEFDGMHFSGQLDKFIKLGERVLVVDEKFVLNASSEVRPRYAIQLSAYCHGLLNGETYFARGSKSELLGEKLLQGHNAFFQIVERHRLTREELFRSEQTAFQHAWFESRLERFKSILSDELQYEDYNLAPREACQYCEFCQSCPRLGRQL